MSYKRKLTIVFFLCMIGLGYSQGDSFSKEKQQSPIFDGGGDIVVKTTNVDSPTSTRYFHNSSQDSIVSKQLDEVVVVGYGTQKARDLTAPIATISGESLLNKNVSSPVEALQGMLSGVQVISNGAPGSTPNIRIRGIGTLQNSNPLFVVDGVFTDNIDFLNNSDIQDITILKDASSAAIYGVKAANGVVLVTTKKGTYNKKPTVTVDAYAGVQVATNIERLANTTQYITLMNELNKGNAGYPLNVGDYTSNTQWFKELLKPAFIQNYQASVTGGIGRIADYAIGGNYLNQGGVLRYNNSYERINLRAQFNVQVLDNLKISFNGVFSNSTQYVPNNDAFYKGYYFPPVYSVYDPTNTNAFPVDFTSPTKYPFVGNSLANPMAIAYYQNDRITGNRFLPTITAELSFLEKSLVIRSSLNQEYNTTAERNYMPSYLVGGSQGTTTSMLTKINNIYSAYFWDNIITYKAPDIRGFKMTYLLGNSVRSQKNQFLQGSAVNVPGITDESMYIVNGDASGRNATDGGYKYNGLSFFTRESFSYEDKYLLNFTFRADASSKYNQKWGFFPSVGLGWVMSEESFMKSIKSTLNFLKIRGSWGLLGNDNIPANSTYIAGQTGVNSSAIWGNALIPGIGAQTVYKNFLKWESVEEFDVGVEFGLWNNIFSGSIDWYRRTTRNMVFYAPIAAGGGTGSLLSNNGSVLNQGVEINLQWSQTFGKTKHTISLNLTYLNNKVLSLQGVTSIPGGSVGGANTTLTQPGYPIGSFWGYKVIGVYNDQIQPFKDKNSSAGPGDFRYADINGNGIYGDVGDRTYLGSPLPIITSGLQYTFAIANFDVSISFYGQWGNKVYNAKRAERTTFAGANWDANFVANRWTPDNPSSTYPSTVGLNSGYNQQPNSFFVEDGSFFRIQNIAVGYTIPFKKWGTGRSIRIYATAFRPLTLFGYNGFTPEILSTDPTNAGIDRNTYPLQSVYSLGCRLVL